MRKIALVLIVSAGMLITNTIVAAANDLYHADTQSSTNATSVKPNKWGVATLTLKDEKGKVVLQKTEKYPIVDLQTFQAAGDFNNCWDWCHRTCDGYGVCFVSCGVHCSPWTK
jgi:hypothetical protein